MSWVNDLPHQIYAGVSNGIVVRAQRVLRRFPTKDAFINAHRKAITGNLNCGFKTQAFLFELQDWFKRERWSQGGPDSRDHNA